MAKKKEYINDIDWVRVFQRVPEITGLDLTLRGKAWEGRYYITTEPHPYKHDKLKIKLFDGCVWLHEQGGPSMSLPTWLTLYGGANDYKHAFEIIRGKDKPLTQRPEFVAKKEQINYVSPDVLQGAKAYDLNKCPLFRWMCTLFPEDRVKAVFDMYNVTTDSKGAAVYWYVNGDGKICHDKRCYYGEDGHRIKTLPMSRQFRIGDGYTEKPYFGSHLKGEVKGIVEAEKTALLASLYLGGIWYATGGKGNLRDVGNIPLYPDRDAEDSWSAKGDCVPWYQDWPECGEHSDLGDYIEWKIKNNCK